MNIEEKLSKIDQILDEFKKETAKDCCKISLAEGEPAITDNKIGGQPYLPVGEEYPTDKDGAPLALLLQVNLKDVDLPDWPKEGILEIFTDALVDYPCQYAVKYFPADQEYQKDLPEVDTSSYISPIGHKITLEKATTYMSPNDFRFSGILGKICGEIYGQEFPNIGSIMDFFEGNDTLQDQMFRLNSTVPGITLGGYSDFVQWDPRDGNEELASKTEALFKLDSAADTNSFEIGDTGILFSFISPEDLRDKKFEEAVVDWDCA